MNNPRTLANGRHVTLGERENVLGPSINDRQRVDLVRAAEHVTNWNNNLNGETKIIYQATAVGEGYWRYWCGTHWKLYEDVCFHRDLDWLFGGQLLSRQLKELVATLKVRLGVPHAAFDTKPITVFKNCALEIRDHKIRIYKPAHQRDDYVTQIIPVALAKTATPKWDAMLDMILPEKQDQQCLAELFGYSFFSSLQLQAFFLMHGDAATGKSTILAVLRAMVGADRVTSVPLSSLHETHATSGLAESLLNVDSEAEYMDPKAEGVLKMLTGDSPININPKWMQPYSKTLPVKLILAANEMPRITDRSEGVWDRLVTIPFNCRVPGNKRKTVTRIVEELTPEFGGILAWGLHGLERVLASGRSRAAAFTQSEQAKEKIVEHRRYSNSVEEWLDEKIDQVADAAIPKQVAYKHYREWCADMGYRALANNKFGMLMMKKEWISEIRPAGQSRCYNGCSFRSESGATKAPDVADESTIGQKTTA